MSIKNIFRIFWMKKARMKHQVNCFECVMRPSHGMMNSKQSIDGSAHYVRGEQRDDHRTNRKRLIAIPFLSGERLGNSVRIYLERRTFPSTPTSNADYRSTPMVSTSYQLSTEQ